MGIVIRQGSKAAVVSYVGAFFGYLNWLYFYPKWASADEVGLFKALFDASLLFVPFLQAGAANLVVKFAPHFQDNEKKERQFSAYIFGLPVLVTALFTFLFFIFKESIANLYQENSPLFVDYLWYIIPLAAVSVFVIIVESLIRVKMRIVIPRIIREVFIRILNTFLVLFYFLDFISLKGVIIGFILINVIQLFGISFYYLKLRGKLIIPSWGITKTRYIRPLFDYSFFMVLGSGSGMLVGKLDTLMTTYLLGLSQTAVYGIAFLIAQVIELPRRTFTAILAPLVAKAYKQKDFVALQDYYHRSALNLSIIGFLLFLGIWSNINLVYFFVPDKEIYSTGKWVVLIIGFSKIADMGMGINNEIITNSKYYRWNIYLTPALAVIAIGTNLIFIPKYGISGAAIATLISVVLYNGIRVYLLKRKMKITPFRWSNLKIFGLGILTFFITEIIQIDNVWVDLIVNMFVVLIAFIFPIIYFKISDDANRFYGSVLKRVFKK